MSSRPHKPRTEIYVVGIWPIGYHHFVAMEIMSAPISWSARVWTLSCSLFLSQAAGLLAAELVLQKVPPVTIEQSAAYPQDVARYCLVAQVEAVLKAIRSRVCSLARSRSTTTSPKQRCSAAIQQPATPCLMAARLCSSRSRKSKTSTALPFATVV